MSAMSLASADFYACLRLTGAADRCAQAATPPPRTTENAVAFLRRFRHREYTGPTLDLGPPPAIDGFFYDCYTFAGGADINYNDNWGEFADWCAGLLADFLGSLSPPQQKIEAVIYMEETYRRMGVTIEEDIWYCDIFGEPIDAEDMRDE